MNVVGDIKRSLILPTHKRAEEIADYLINFGINTKDYLILDDSDYGFNDVLGRKRFIRTSSTDGMLFSHMKDVWSLIGAWNRK